MFIEVLTGFVGGVVAGVVGGSIAGYYAGWQYQIELEHLKRRVDSLWGVQNSAKGVAAREERSEEMQNAISEAAIIIKGGGSNEEKTAKLAEVATKYPRVAMKIGKQLGLI